jgi:HD-GYP domain-containing protein (c-di-GMP phosphodiesterase class II)
MLFEQAAQEIVAGAGTQFDPDVVKAFLRVPREEWEALTQNMPDTQADSNSLRYAA